VVCRFDRLLVDWQDTIDRVRQGLDLALPRNSPAAHAEVEQFLARDMRHHDAREDAGLGLLGAFDWLRRTFGIMQHWADQGEEAADHAELDRIRTEFDNAYPAFSRLLLSSGYSGEFATGSRLRDQLQHQLVEVSERAQAIAQQATEVESLRAAATRVSGLEVEIARLVAREAELARWIDTQDSKIAAAVEASESERKLRNEIEQELTTREAELAQEKLGNAELTGRILAAESAAVQRQEELAQLWSQLEALQQAAGAATAEIAAERARRTEAEAQLAEEARNLRNLAAEKSELEASIRAAEAAALERQQEVAQLWNQLGTVQQAAGAATAEGAVERERRVDAEARLAEAMQDLRGLGSEKGELEIRVRIAEMALASQRDEQLRAAEQLAEAKAATEAAATQGEWERKFRLEREGQLTEAQSELADLRAQLESLQQAPVPTAVFDELAQLTRLLQASETEAAAAAAARAAAERRVAEQTEELIRLSALLSQENGRAEGSAGYAEWLREMSRVVEAMPKWWGMMPESWRRKREHEAYRRTGLFDAQLYLQNYPDVAADGMDPVRHYIQHGMAEGRQMWR
jgi:chromosome segregation ATPase